MGSFFTNIQVHIGEIPPDEARHAVIRAIQDHAARSGLETVAPGEPAERSVLIGAAGHAPWISVFDEAGDDQDGDRLRELAEVLSAPAGVALGILVHDSDILELRLCRAGAQVDVFNSRPNYFRQVSANRRRQLAGRPSHWSDLLVGGRRRRDLRVAWDKSGLPAEELLMNQIAPLLGLDANWCATGYTYLDRGERDFVDDENAGLLRLGFRGHSEPVEYADGPPQFVRFGGDNQVNSMVGEEVRALLSVANRGGLAHGLYAVAWGSALELGLLHLQSVRIIGRPQRGANQITIETPLIADRTEKGAPHRAILPDAKVGPGLSGRYADALVLTTTESTAPDASGSIVGALFIGTATTAGSGELYLALAPMGDKPATATFGTRVVVSNS